MIIGALFTPPVPCAVRLQIVRPVYDDYGEVAMEAAYQWSHPRALKKLWKQRRRK